MKKNLKELNPELDGGDRIVLIYMDDFDPVPIGTIGIVDSETPKLNRPKQKKGDCGFAYNVTWYEKDEDTGELKYSRKIPLHPEDDSWIFDKDHYK